MKIALPAGSLYAVLITVAFYGRIFLKLHALALLLSCGTLRPPHREAASPTSPPYVWCTTPVRSSTLIYLFYAVWYGTKGVFNTHTIIARAIVIFFLQKKKQMLKTIE